MDGSVSCHLGTREYRTRDQMRSGLGYRWERAQHNMDAEHQGRKRGYWRKVHYYDPNQGHREHEERPGLQVIEDRCGALAR